MDGIKVILPFPRFQIGQHSGAHEMGHIGYMHPDLDNASLQPPDAERVVDILRRVAMVTVAMAMAKDALHMPTHRTITVESYLEWLYIVSNHSKPTMSLYVEPKLDTC